MAANTTDGITYPTGTDAYNYAAQMAALATTTQAALDKRVRKPVDLAALNVVTGMSSGDIAAVQEGGALYEYNGSAWVQKTPAVFSTTSARDTAYAKASGAYRVIEAMATVTGITYRYSGSAWQGWWSDWITYTPTIANVTQGNGVFNASYRYRTGTVLVEGSLAFGSTSSISGTPRITHPVTTSARNALDSYILGTSSFLDFGTAAYIGCVIAFSTTTADIRTNAVVGGYNLPGGLNATTPFTWTANDVMMWRYEISQ